MATPTLKYVEPTTPEADLRFKPEPVEIYGMPSGGGAVESVNGQTGAVVLDADDVGARATGVDVPWADIDGVPATLTAAAAAGTASIRAIGTTATTAAAGNHTHAASAVTATAIAPGTATNVQGILAELAARIAALESAG